MDARDLSAERSRDQGLPRARGDEEFEDIRGALTQPGPVAQHIDKSLSNFNQISRAEATRPSKS
jgi:hypothetical protein